MATDCGGFEYQFVWTVKLSRGPTLIVKATNTLGSFEVDLNPKLSADWLRDWCKGYHSSSFMLGQNSGCVMFVNERPASDEITLTCYASGIKSRQIWQQILVRKDFEPLMKILETQEAARNVQTTKDETNPCWRFSKDNRGIIMVEIEYERHWLGFEMSESLQIKHFNEFINSDPAYSMLTVGRHFNHAVVCRKEPNSDLYYVGTLTSDRVLFKNGMLLTDKMIRRMIEAYRSFVYAQDKKEPVQCQSS